MKFEYPVRFREDGRGTFLISCRDLPEVVSESGKGEDRLEIAEGAVQAAIEYRILKDLEIPIPSGLKRGEHCVALPPETAAKAALYLVMRERGFSKVDLAKHLRVNEKEVRRMLDPGHSTKIPRIAHALKALGKTLRLELL
jgi:antitoxin HicB